PGRIFGNQLAGFAPPNEVPERLDPVARGVRRHGVEEGDDELPRQGRQPLIAVFLAEALKDGTALGRRAAGEGAETLTAVIRDNGGRHASRLAARILADRNRGSSEGGLIGGHELGRARNARKLDIGRAAATEGRGAGV